MEKLTYDGETITLENLLIQTGAFPSLTQVRKLTAQKGLRIVKEGKRVAVTDTDLKTPCEDLAETLENGFRVTWGHCGLLVCAHMNTTVWYEKGW
jgi:hypothetical protein